MGSLSTIMLLLQIAGQAEPIIAAVAATLIPALKQLHESHGDAILLADLGKLFHQHGLPEAAASVVSVGPQPEGQGTSTP